MIAYIAGKLTHKEPAYVIIDVQGVGYQILISLQTYSALSQGEERCRLYTYLSIREDAHVLYGFATFDEKALFLDLISVSGIGPNTALMMLSSLSSAEIRQAIVSEDVRTIQSIKGIGSKTAQRAIIDLKDKFKKDNLMGSTPALFPVATSAIRNEALAALTTLGIQKAVAEKNIDVILKKYGNDITLEQLIKMALR
ncbi:MAG: Holliday junction branch migration protein RuvA [Spirosomataceae bacterium]